MYLLKKILSREDIIIYWRRIVTTVSLEDIPYNTPIFGTQKNLYPSQCIGICATIYGFCAMKTFSSVQNIIKTTDNSIYVDVKCLCHTEASFLTTCRLKREHRRKHYDLKSFFFFFEWNWMFQYFQNLYMYIIT